MPQKKTSYNRRSKKQELIQKLQNVEILNRAYDKLFEDGIDPEGHLPFITTDFVRPKTQKPIELWTLEIRSFWNLVYTKTQILQRYRIEPEVLLELYRQGKIKIRLYMLGKHLYSRHEIDWLFREYRRKLPKDLTINLFI